MRYSLLAHKLKIIFVIPVLVGHLLVSFSTFAEVTQYQYDDLHRLTRVERSDGSITTYQYDELDYKNSSGFGYEG